ncbi:MAG: response regulator [Deltaproteobacteria bacterium]|nr:response regulator [Deltaproteobacteria bacterium]
MYAETHSPKKILIIEDDESLETIFDQAIRNVEPDCQIDWATSVEAALFNMKVAASVNGGSYDLIIADIFLEGDTTGIDFWQSCQFLYPDTPVIVTSSIGIDEFFRIIGRSAISPPFLPKPIRLGECRQLLKTLLKYSADSRLRHAA